MSFYSWWWTLSGPDPSQVSSFFQDFLSSFSVSQSEQTAFSSDSPTTERVLHFRPFPLLPPQRNQHLLSFSNLLKMNCYDLHHIIGHETKIPLERKIAHKYHRVNLLPHFFHGLTLPKIDEWQVLQYMIEFFEMFSFWESFLYLLLACHSFSLQRRRCSDWCVGIWFCWIYTRSCQCSQSNFFSYLIN